MQIPNPHPSFIQVAKPYVFEHTIQECLAATGVDPQREDDIRISGVTWIDNVRKALRLYVISIVDMANQIADITQTRENV
jgi:CTD kinase subunit beta